MKKILFENEKNADKNLKSIELVGLSRSGKTTYLKKLIKNGKKGILIEQFSFLDKIFNFFIFLIKHPLRAGYLYYKLNTNNISIKELNFKDYLKIKWLRNSYLSAVFYKYIIAKRIKNEFFIDEFLIQSILMILNKKTNEEKIREVINFLPKSNKILLIETDRKTRYGRIKKTRFPAQQINKAFSIEWMKHMEFNFEIIKKILEKEYGPVRNDYGERIS